MTVLRVYDPPECDSAGVPLDWKCCRTCGGSGRWCECDRGERTPLNCWSCSKDRCPTCDGHGSLKAAVLAAMRGFDGPIRGMFAPRTIRCEDCGHPMSEGTWEGHRLADDPHHQRSAARSAETYLREYDGIPPRPMGLDFYSPCDEGCRHGGPGRGPLPGDSTQWQPFLALTPESLTNVVLTTPGFEASWRPVDVRTLSYPNVLLPEKLAVLCLRCWVARMAI